MPREAAVAMREAVAKENRAEFMLERTAWNDSGFVNVQKIGNKFRARLQVPGDGRGGNLKRRQYPVPGIFDTAEDAAVALRAGDHDPRREGEQRRQVGGPAFAEQAAQAKRQEAVAARAGSAAACRGTDANGYCHGHAHPIPYVACASRGCVAAPDAASVLCNAALSGPKTIVYVLVYVCPKTIAYIKNKGLGFEHGAFGVRAYTHQTKPKGAGLGVVSPRFVSSATHQSIRSLLLSLRLLP